MLFMGFEGDGVDRAVLGTKGTANAIVGDLIFDKILAFSGRTLSPDMRFILFPEIGQRGQNGIGSCSA
jgi:hypothetical protein